MLCAKFSRRSLKVFFSHLLAKLLEGSGSVLPFLITYSCRCAAWQWMQLRPLAEQSQQEGMAAWVGESPFLPLSRTKPDWAHKAGMLSQVCYAHLPRSIANLEAFLINWEYAVRWIKSQTVRWKLTLKCRHEMCPPPYVHTVSPKSDRLGVDVFSFLFILSDFSWRMIGNSGSSPEHG